MEKEPDFIYLVLGPGGLQGESANADEALRMGGKWATLPPQRYDALKTDLIQGRTAKWGSGFVEVWVIPRPASKEHDVATRNVIV